MEYIKKRLDEIKPYANNPRINDDAVDDVAESIRQCGYIAPIVIDENSEILAGHTRYKALLKLGKKECDVIVVSGLSEEQKRKYRLYDNKTGELSQWDQKKLAQELSDVDFCGYDFGQSDVVENEEVGRESEKKIKTCPCCGEVFEI